MRIWFGGPGLRWLRRWRKRDDLHPVKRTEPDPIEELIRVVNEAHDRDDEYEHGLYQGVVMGQCLNQRQRGAKPGPQFYRPDINKRKQ
jgi:hypothetical protein